MAVIKMNFLSQALGMQTNITICLPTYSFADAVADRREVYVPGMKYQVLWLLHGGSGDDSDYLNFSNIARYADENKIAVANTVKSVSPAQVEELQRLCSEALSLLKESL